MSAERSWISNISVLILVLCWAPHLHADPINLGILSFDSFIPGSTGTPGTVTVGIENLTGLPPDFYDIPIDFTSVQLSLTFTDNLVFGCSIGTVGASGANTDCQVPDTSSLSLILLTGNIPTIITSGGSFNTFSTSLNPSTDALAVISIGETGTSPVPEPPSLLLLLSGLATACLIHRCDLRLVGFLRSRTLQIETLNQIR